MTSAITMLRSSHAEANGFLPSSAFEPFELAHAETTLADKFRKVASACASRLALSDDNGSLTYAELLSCAENIAAHLRARSSGPEGVVAICLPSARETVETMLGALLGGYAYLCIDPAMPAPLVLELLQAAGPVHTAGLDYRGEPAPLSTRGPGGIAALYATSGSTGEPKLVALSHRAILFDIGRQTNDLFLGPSDRFDSLFSFAFSAALATTFRALLNGAELHCRDARSDIAALPEWLAARRITVSTMTVSMLRHLCLLGRGQFPELRLLSVSGEALRPADVAAFRTSFPPSCVLQNAMASTETRTYAQYFVPPAGDVPDPVPIGWPVAGKEVTLVDEGGAPAPPGEPGEIIVRSRYLAAGYANDSLRTAARFEPQPDGSTLYRTGDRGRFLPDGSLLFLGRTDSQVKIRGHRVELDAVACALESHPRVRTAVVVTSRDAAGNDRLVAHVVPHSETPVEQELREFLRARLAPYAMPSFFFFLPDLPVNANFKLDRRLLPEPPAVPSVSAGSEATIEVLREIWRETLQRAEVPDDAAFSDLGGDSLAAVRLFVAAGERFGCRLSPDCLHRFPTLAQLAGHLEEIAASGAPDTAALIFQKSGSGCPVFFMGGLGGWAGGYAHLGERLDRPAYGLNSMHWNDDEAFSVESMAASLSPEVRKLVPGDKVVLVGHSFGGIIAFEMARQLRAADLDALPVVIDMPAVNAPGIDRAFGRRVLDVIRNLPAWSVHEAAHFRPREFGTHAYGHLRRLGRALRAQPSTELDPMVYFGKTHLPQSYQAFLNRQYRAMLAYVPAPFNCPMVLLRAQTPTLFRSTRDDLGWRAVAASVEVHSVPGSHHECVSQRYSERLARLLTECAARFESGAAMPAGSDARV